ncbi:MAG: extra-cytoplasmic solute receptor protein [Rhizobium sp.]|nr:extra-cytoplasmic solute receptor protein [Rhizobium sp.]
MKRRRIAIALSVLAMVSAFAGSASSQTYPSQQIRIIVPVAAGGLTDLIARIAADYITTRTGQTAIVDNRTGGAGMIGVGAVVRSQPDGYTLAMVINGDIVISPYLFKSMPFDPLTDLRPVALLAEAPQLMVVNSSVPAKTLGELIAYAKANPGKLNYASTGIGSSAHLGAYLFTNLAGVSITHVPYRGAAPAVNDLVAGHVQMMHLSLGPVAGQVAAGTLRVLAVAMEHRWDALPNVPTSKEAGLPGYLGTAWFGMFAPKGTPDEVIERLNGLMRDMTADPKISARFKEAFVDPTTKSVAEFQRQIVEEAPKWQRMIRETGATAE